MWFFMWVFVCSLIPNVCKLEVVESVFISEILPAWDKYMYFCLLFNGP